MACEVQESGRARQDQSLRRPAEIDGEQIDGFGQSYMKRVGSFQYDHARIAAELPGQGAVGGVYGEHLCRAAPQQTIHESTHVAAEIGTAQVAHIELKGVQCGGKFHAAARNV